MTDPLDIKAIRARSDAAKRNPLFTDQDGKRWKSREVLDFMDCARTDIPAMADWIEEAAVELYEALLRTGNPDREEAIEALLNRLKPAG